MPDNENIAWVSVTPGQSEILATVQIQSGVPGPQGEVTLALLVGNEAARLALTAEQALDKVVVQGDDSSIWTLVADGNPSNPADWVRTLYGEPGMRITITASPTPPPNPLPNDEWFETTTGSRFLYYLGAWVEISVGEPGGFGEQWLTQRSLRIDQTQDLTQEQRQRVIDSLGEAPEFQGIKLVDTSSLILPANVLGLDANGEIVRHDGVTMGGVRIYAANPNRVRLARKFSESELGNNTTVVELGRVPVAAADMVVGKRLSITGNVGGVLLTDAEFFVLRFSFASMSAGDQGLYYYLETGDVVNQYILNVVSSEFTSAGGNIIVPPSPGPYDLSFRLHKETIEAGAGAITHHYGNTIDLGDFFAPAEEANFMVVELMIISETTATPGNDLFVTADIQVDIL
jgi:hypothetical protein